MLTKDPSLLGMLRVTVCSAWLLAIVSGQHLLEFPDSVNKSRCIPLAQLQDASVQRGLGVLRNIKKVNLYLTGNGTVDMVVSVATGFQDEDFTRPILHKCEDYKGTAEDVFISVSCLEDDGSESVNGYAVFVKFHGELKNSPAAICQMEIFLRNKDAEESKRAIHSIAIVFGVTCCIIIITGVCVTVWYFLAQRKDNKKEDVKISKNVRFQEEVRTDEHKILINSNCDYEDEVFTLE